jgi:lysophospholipase L1-like esterase
MPELAKSSSRWLKIVAVQTVIALVLLEIGLRLYDPIGARSRGSTIVLPANHVYRFDNGPDVRKLDRHTVHTKNSLGFRGPEPPRDFASRLTMVTIGGSTTESLFLSDGKTWTDVLHRRLESALPAIWINNAGIDGHTSYGHLVLLRQFVVELKPKVAVFLVGANDVALERPNTFDEGVQPTASGMRRLLNAAAARSEVVNFGLNLARAARARERGLGHSELDLSTARKLVLDPDVVTTITARAAATLPGYRSRLEAIVRLAREHGITPVLVTQPALFGDTIDPATRIDLSDVQVNGRGNGHVEWRLLEAVNDVTRDVARAQRLLLIDLARELPKDSRYFYDFLHFTNAGSERVGEIVAAHLLPYLEETF